ncbi:MAG: SPOR domain-containing protein [Candidatus Omnitrophota bacterium]|jgi:septal ring-binding cell division protein DamX
MEDRGQLELFSQAKGDIQVKTRVPGTFRLRISKYEKTILFVIVFALISIISFSLGVEKGRKSALLKVSAPKFDLAVKQQAQPALPAPEKKQQAEEKSGLQEYIDSYTIQVASFSKRVNAQKEADNLKKKGLSALVLVKGKFSIVCVGNFSNKEEAESFLPKLRKQYQDCRIRRL